jgi:catechol 2,3-dioxygenase-like lactoylglutathione lyase family enzyme
MIDHIGVRAQDFSKIVDFYKAALAPIGYRVLHHFEGVVGLGAGGKADLWITQADTPSTPTHIAISGLRPQIQAFHAAALAAGGTDNGLPGPRPDYHEHYYAAFVKDPEGNNIEIVCQDPEGRTLPARKSAAKKKAAGPAAKPAAKKPAPKIVAKAAAKKAPPKKSAKTAPKKAAGKAAKPKKRR